MTRRNNQKQQRKPRHGMPDHNTKAKLSGQLKSMLLGVNVQLTTSTWDVRALSNIAQGAAENERVGQKVQLKELRCRMNL
jgi:hypothetical protein